MIDPEDLLQRYRPVGPPASLRPLALRPPSSRYDRVALRVALAAACVALVLYGMTWRANRDLVERLETPVVLGGAPDSGDIR